MREDRAIIALRSTLTGNRDHFDAIADAMPHFVWLAEVDGTVTFFNRPWVAYTGLTVEGMKKSGVKGVVHPDDRAATLERWTTALETQTAYEMEYRLRNATDGSYRWFLARALPVLDESGKDTRWIGTATDIDEHRRSRESLEFVLKAVDAFGATSDVNQICDRLSKLAVESFADWCFVTLFQAPNVFTTVSAAHKDPARTEKIRALQRKNAEQRCTKDVVDRLAREPLLIPRVADEDARGAAALEHVAVARRLKLYSLMVVPLRAPTGEFYGTVTFGSDESRRAFTQTDLDVAGRAADRAASAMHSVYLFSEEQRTTQRLRLLAKATETLFDSLDLDGAYQRLADVVIPEIADFALVMTIEDDYLRVAGAAHRNKRMSHVMDRLRGIRILQPKGERAVLRELNEHTPALFGKEQLAEFRAETWPHRAVDIKTLDPKSGIRLPIHSRGKTYGGLFVFSNSADRTYLESDLPILVEITNRMAIAIANAESFERERHIAATMQKALLPPALPRTPDLRFDGVYTPTTRGGSVGGDWYDAIALDDGSVMVSVGDVAGSGLEAAVIMSKVRHVIAGGPFHQRDPAKILDAADWILRYRYPEAIVTAFVGLISPDRSSIQFANAGHPPPLVRRNGELIELKAAGLPLGLGKLGDPRVPEQASLAPDDLILLYTDGLTEWNHDPAEGDRRLAEILSSEAVCHASKPARLIHDVCLTGESSDDVALLTVGIVIPDSWSFDSDNALSAQDVRWE
ncbi:MAG: SpoIIE family protein phosphatase, partial [Candidatus Eremiobacteraeota bacterium]|nr:SpoIIE family protein phosphatase [Candidatus Eremiobacteraeota bacterium]